MKKTIIAVSIFSTVAFGAAFAQTVEGIDVKEILGKSSEMKNGVEDLVKHALSRSKHFEEDAKRIDEVAHTKIEENRERLSGILKGDGPIDLEEMINGAAANASGNEKSPARFIVFASLSMPEDALSSLLRDTAKAGGVVVFRGFPNNSSKEFISRLTSAVKEDSYLSNVGIDPRLFRAFNVTAAPTFVAVEDGFEPCDGFDCETKLPGYDRISGNVTVQYVLEQFEEANGPGSKVARMALSNLRRGG